MHPFSITLTLAELPYFWKLSPDRFRYWLALFCASPPFLNASRFSQQEVFKHAIAFATDKLFTANAAGHFLKDRLRSGVDLAM